MKSTEQILEWWEMAIHAGFERENDHILPPTGAISIDPELMRFAEAVATAERKKCAS